MVAVSHCLPGGWCELNLVPGRQPVGLWKLILLFETSPPEADGWVGMKSGPWQWRPDGIGSWYYQGTTQAAKRNHPVLFMMSWSCLPGLQPLLQKDVGLGIDAVSYLQALYRCLEYLQVSKQQSLPPRDLYLGIQIAPTAFVLLGAITWDNLQGESPSSSPVVSTKSNALQDSVSDGRAKWMLLLYWVLHSSESSYEAGAGRKMVNEINVCIADKYYYIAK